ncbi:NUDIX hydrolase domain-like protein [Abortiporus biennis]|nr:NUDIX hydrolase domain-like protein [Abortiporus biennis]
MSSTNTYEPPANFFGANPLNRLSWLRTSHVFLNAILTSPNTQWLVFKDAQPLISTTIESPSSSKHRKLVKLRSPELLSILGPAPYFAQSQNPTELLSEEIQKAHDHVLEAARFHGPPVVFLGLHQAEGSDDALPSSEFIIKGSDDPVAEAQKVVEKINGTAYFSLDVTDLEEELVDALLQQKELQLSSTKAPGEEIKLGFMDTRAALGAYDEFDAAILAAARSMVDWNARNKFCPACGSPIYSLWAGWKLSCSSLLPWAKKVEGKKPCPTAKGLHNFAHPRTDAVVIVAVVNEAGDKTLLGRNRKWPGKFYSCLAGFIEPGESLEDAVRRELWEEAGLKVWGIRYHSTQPWPFPANLMVGFYAIADPNVPTRVDLDNELEDARWYTKDEILAVLSNPEGVNLGSRDPNKPLPPKEPASGAGPLAGDNASKKGDVQDATEIEEPPFKLPPRTAIAGCLISDWAYGKVQFGNSASVLKGNL